MSWLLSLLILLFAFGVLVGTFVWIARLLVARGRQAPELSEASADAQGEEAPIQTPIQTPEELEAEDLEKKRTGVGVNATLGLVLSVLACLLFWVSPLLLVLSVAALWFSGNALWLGLRLFGVFIGRAALGVLLSLCSFALHFLYLTGQMTMPF